MSNISSNTLFHFTSKAEYLIGILTNNFIPRFCHEQVLFNGKPNGARIEAAIPMICFCDISLGQINNHIHTYGSYGIGMSKEWGIKKKLNPIIYINENSIVADAIVNLSTHIVREEVSKTVDREFSTITKYFKPYKGDFKRNGKTIKNVRFYNEREWRFIPDIQDTTIVEKVLQTEDYNNPIKLAQANSKLNNFPLEFSPDDIKYIFVKDEAEIHSMIEALREIKGSKFDQKTLDILTSKIITTKKLEEDF